MPGDRNQAKCYICTVTYTLAGFQSYIHTFTYIYIYIHIYIYAPDYNKNGNQDTTYNNLTAQLRYGLPIRLHFLLKSV